jgi:hypothetical protein
MGAASFTVIQKAKTAGSAFDLAREGDPHDPLAAKQSFVMYPAPKGVDLDNPPPSKDGGLWIEEYAMTLIMAPASKLTKWGPAGCIQTSVDEFLFFGWLPE